MVAVIPDDLIRMVREGRVIPFVGAGVSANIGYPTWEELLRDIAMDDSVRSTASRDEAELSYEEIEKFTGGDKLRIAEYLHIIAGKQTGLLRRVIERRFSGQGSPLQYGGFVELANLNAPLIYTTNFDDLIERTYRALGVRTQLIRNARDIAKATPGEVQIVKYHGDTSDDSSLVLTETSYYRRLNFEAPLDLKFRADLLGRSVLFLGYSLSDINIRVIWFRLLDMMNSVDPREQPRSYAVIPIPNPVQQKLYEDVRIETIVLDESGQTAESEWGALLAEFLCDLAGRAVQPGSARPIYASRTLIARAKAEIYRRVRRSVYFEFGPTPGAMTSLERTADCEIPKDYIEDLLALFEEDFEPTKASARLAIKLWNLTSDRRAGGHVVVARTRSYLVDDGLVDLVESWQQLWDLDLGVEGRKRIVQRHRTELEYHLNGEFDDDLFYTVDILIRLANGGLGATAPEASMAREALRATEEHYPGIVNKITAAPTKDLHDLAELFRPPDEERNDDEDDDSDWLSDEEVPH